MTTATDPAACIHCGWPVTSYWQWVEELCFVAPWLYRRYFIVWGSHEVSQEHMRTLFYPDGAKTA